MVGAKNIGINGRFPNLVPKPVGNQKVIDPPSGVFLPGMEPVAPPAVCAGLFRVKEAEGVRKAAVYQSLEAAPLLIGKTGAAPVGARILQIDFTVRDISITVMIAIEMAKEIKLIKNNFQNRFYAFLIAKVDRIIINSINKQL